MTQATGSPLDSVTSADWQWLAGQRIFFGHQSVGQDIIDGLQDVLADHPEIPLKIVATREPEGVAGPGLIHSIVGRNGDPASKVREFRAVVLDASTPFSVALLKFCYVDAGLGTDPDALFASYLERIDSLRAPGRTIVHVTMPLTASETGVRAFAKRVLGRSTQADVNAIRNRYNDLLRSHYGGRDPVFDLATAESTRLDGSRTFALSASDTVFALAREYTSDGAHLNQVGQRRVAEAFLAFLARLRPEAPGAAGA